MKIYLACIGTELLTEKINTHINYIGSWLRKLGLELTFAITLPDKIKEMVKWVKSAYSESDILIITGGLGPTFDDLTRECVSQVLNEDLIFEPRIMEKINYHFARIGIPTPKFNEKQAYIFKGSRIIDNDVGTAPGLIVERDNKSIILLPGPPRELYPMFEGYVIDYLRQKVQVREYPLSKSLHIYGYTESKVHELIFDIINSYKSPDIEFSILPHAHIIEISFLIKKPKNEAESLCSELKNRFYEVLGKSIFAEDNEPIESVVGKLLREKNKKIAIAESCTGGLVMDKITNVPGSSEYFLTGVVAYSNESKIKLLSVNEEIIKNYGAVSEEAAREMALGIKKLSGADISLSVTGIAGPGGGSIDKPVGLVYFCIIIDDREIVDKKVFIGTRTEIKEFAAFHVLDLLRRELV